jgi:hypothetical protein
MEPMKTFARTKAVLKSPHSRRYRDCQAVLNFAKRLECGVFTAAFARTTRHRIKNPCESSMPPLLSITLRLLGRLQHF